MDLSPRPLRARAKNAYMSSSLVASAYVRQPTQRRFKGEMVLSWLADRIRTTIDTTIRANYCTNIQFFQRLIGFDESYNSIGADFP